MPFKNVVIKANFVNNILTNPKTLSGIAIVLLVLGGVFGTLFYTKKRKLNEFSFFVYTYIVNDYGIT